MKTTKTFLVTGGAGFIGSHLCENLLEMGFKVICVDNLLTGSSDNVSSFLSDDNFRFINHDVTKDLYLPDSVFAVLHFASPASPSDYHEFPIQTLKVGSLGTHKMLGLAKAKGARFLLASTSEVYGDPLIHPQEESYWGNVNPVGPRGVYDEAKRFSEAMVMAYRRVHKVDTRIARIFNTYGPRMRPNDGRAIPEFINQALKGKPVTVFGSGKQTRSFCYVDDTVDGLLKLLFSDYKEPVNIGNPYEMSIERCANTLISLTKSKSKIVYKKLPIDDPRTRCPNISIAKKVLKWEPKISSTEGFRKTINFFKKKYLENKTNVG